MMKRLEWLIMNTPESIAIVLTTLKNRAVFLGQHLVVVEKGFLQALRRLIVQASNKS